MMKYIFFLLLSLRLFANEMVYGVMITGKDVYHYDLALRSILSFVSQSYENKRLIIINDGEYDFKKITNTSVTEINLKKKLSLGELRNIGLDQLPENAVWIQWDDDDWHHHELIEKQYEFMKQSNVDLTLLKSQVQYAFSKDAAWVKTKLNPGTIMCRNKKELRYPLWKKREDSKFYHLYNSAYSTKIWENSPFLYIRMIHGHNTWSDHHFKLDKRVTGARKIDNASIDYLKDVIRIYKEKNNDAILSEINTY